MFDIYRESRGRQVKSQWRSNRGITEVPHAAQTTPPPVNETEKAEDGGGLLTPNHAFRNGAPVFNRLKSFAP